MTKVALDPLFYRQARFHEDAAPNETPPQFFRRLNPFLERLADVPLDQWASRAEEASLAAADSPLVRFLESLAQVSYRYSPWIQGGFAGVDNDGAFVLALARWACWLAPLRRAAAAHELFHFARHCRGEMPFPPPDREYSWTQLLAWLWHDNLQMWWEEGRIWKRTFVYEPLGSFLIVLPLIVLIVLMIALFAIGYARFRRLRGRK